MMLSTTTCTGDIFPLLFHCSLGLLDIQVKSLFSYNQLGRMNIIGLIQADIDYWDRSLLFPVCDCDVPFY